MGLVHFISEAHMIYKSRNCYCYPMGVSLKGLPAPEPEDDEDEDCGELELIEQTLVFSVWAMGVWALFLLLILAACHFSVF